jgi:hypothetical protein
MVMNGDFPNLKSWNTNLIIQKDNFLDLKQYVLNQLEYGSKPIITASLIVQWVHLSDEKFKNMAVWNPEHPQYSEFKEMLQDPIFNNSLSD